MVLGASSGEMLRFVDFVAVATVVSPSDSSSRGNGVVAAQHFGGDSGRSRKSVSMKQKNTAPRDGSMKYQLLSVDASIVSPTASYGAGAGPYGSEQIPRILGFSERIQVLTVASSAGAAGRKTRRGLAPLHAVHVKVATIIPENCVETDEAVDEAVALARAAAKAARDAARDAAAFAEAQALADDSSQVFPSKQDLLLLERARLTEMARSGAVQSSSPETVDGHRVPSLWKEWEFSSRDLDSGLEQGLDVSTLEQGLFQQPYDDRKEDRTGESVRRRRSDTVTVRSNRRRERILKRERALLRADIAAAAAVTPGPSKAKKPQLVYDAADPVRAYLRDIGKTKLLTAAEEVGLAEGIQDLLRMESVKADLMEQMGREPSILEWAKAVGTEHLSLESRIKSGQACKDKMVNSNLRLVVSIAKRYQGRGMTIQDLIQEGSMGLIRGAEKFDHTRGFKFSTYAHWWIRQAITRAIADQSRTIRLPVHVYELLSRITKARSMLASEHGRVPRDEEVAELVGLNIEKLKLVIKSAKSPKSLEYPVGKNNDTLLGEVIPDKDVESPEEAISKRLLKQDLNTVLDTLTPRERDVLKLRYGLEDGRMRTLEEIGNVFNVTRERIRQIESKALRKLRQPSRNTSLREYLDLNP